MNLPEPIPQPPSPPSPAGQLWDRLVGSAFEALLAVAIGAMAMRVMRAWGLHWSWAALALAMVLLGWPDLGVLAPALAVATGWAALGGARRHRSDVEAGDDLAELAAARRVPLDCLMWLLRYAGDRLRPPGSGERVRGEPRMPLGRDERGRSVSLPWSGDVGGHTLVVGATGSGKTVTETWIAVRAIERGRGAVVIDPKGDTALCEELRGAALASARPFLRWSPCGDCIYNPYARGTDTEIADKVLAGERFTEPHYLRQAQRYLGHVVRALRASPGEVGVGAIVDHLEPRRLELALRALPEGAAAATHAYLDSLTSRQHAELGGVRDRLAILAESDVGPWLDPRRAGAARLELRQAVSERAVVYFNLEADSRPLLAQMLGAAIVQDLLTAVAALQRDPTPTLVVIDEFSAIAAEQVVRLFGRARSAGFSLLLGTQELSDLRPPEHVQLLEQVMGNLSLLIAHRQVVPASAELIARVAGTRGTWRTAQLSDGRRSRARTREHMIAPDRIMGLAPGWAAVIPLGVGEGARITHIFRVQGRGAAVRAG